MENQNILIMCRRCGKKNPVKDMKFDANGKDLICAVCAKGSISTVKSVPKATTSTVNKPVMVKYSCTSCKYKFSRKKEIGMPNVCPFCGKPSVQKDQLTSADNLLDAVSDK